MEKETSRFRFVTQADYNTNQRDIDTDWEKYVMDGIEPESVRPVIMDSWQRCRHLYHIDPKTKKSHVSLSSEQLLTSREQNEALRLARPFLDELTTVLKDTGHNHFAFQSRRRKRPISNQAGSL